MMRSSFVAALLLAAASVQLCSAHVRLTFPPARFPNYDFLDNVRTGGPCGVPDAGENAQVTTLVAGSSVNVTYHLAYPHRGGIRVNILDENGTITHALLGLITWHHEDDSTAFHQQVQLPANFTCERCVLQLVRQAAEWRATGGYLFWSCSDISIQNSGDVQCDESYCSGQGTCNNFQCSCNRTYSGEFCQYKDECEDASDCSSNGECIDLMSTTFPRRQCFCNPGFFGEACSRVSVLTDPTIEESQYSLRTVLSDRLTMYARIIENEIEIALSHAGTSYVALGWKPRALDADCRAAAPGFFRVGTNPLWPDGQTWPLADGVIAHFNSTGAWDGSVYSEEEGEEGEEEGGEEEGGAESIHAMDCADVVMGQARGNRFRILDYYTRDRATPRLDSFYGGDDDITAAVGREVNGVTSIKFRRPLSTGDSSADHVISNEVMRVIWSFGQVFPDYYHLPASGIEAETVSNPRFYQPDEIKYHGTRNRGATSINFFDKTSVIDPNACTARFNTSCNAQGVCEYAATWTVSGDFVDFTVSARVSLDQWVAIGFSDDTFMPASDVVAGAVGDSGFFVTDRYASARAQPPVDTVQNLQLISATHNEGVTTVSFRRPRVTDDSNDISLNECRYFMFGWGGPATVATGVIGYHPSTPIISQDRICLPSPANCPDTAGTAMTTVSVATMALLTILSLSFI